MSKPNLFSYATKELSQDAFICWLLEWADPQNTGSLIYESASSFIEQLSNINRDEINKLEIRRQYKSIDIVAVINDKYAILIEDKVHSKNHSNQLISYQEILKEEFESDNIRPIYLKTGDQSNYRTIESKGYRTYKRENFLSLLKQGKKDGIRNEIYLDFLDYLNGMENSVNSYKLLPVNKWHWDSWKGFYLELQKSLGQGEWDYVHQKNGGFLGFWWLFRSKSNNTGSFNYYLQLEQTKFCFKVSPSNVLQNREVRDYYRNLLFQKATDHGIKIRRNGRCISGKTKTMTVAKLENSYLVTDSNGLLNMALTVKKIEDIEKLIKEI